METTTFIKTLHYGTLRSVAKDLADQIDDHDNFFIEDIKPDPQDIIRHTNLVLAFGNVIKIYCGEGGLPINDPIHGEQLERIVDKYFNEIKSELRKY